MPRLRPLLIFVCVFTACFADSAFANKRTDPTAPSHKRSIASKNAVAGKFDYYLMSLSWSPTFCQTHPDDKEQCGKKGYGFVLHGLWPQYEGGNGPQRCQTEDEPDGKTVARAQAFMPNEQLITHEWFMHGTCSGLKPQAFFDLADRAFASVHVPPELQAPRTALQTDNNHLRAWLRSANPGLGDNMLTLHCSGGEFVEARICLDKNLTPRACGSRVRNGCPASDTFTIPATK
ncbi:MAG: ribonuclease T2 [Rhodanobacter sp.]|jgi:ribonuclease T2|nr:ribonuclease T2 [Rhodanobacter sp.]